MDANIPSRENAHLKARLAEVEAALAEVQEANRRLEGILRASQRERFGKSSEKLSPDQFNLPLEDAELAQGVLEAAQEKAEAALARARGEEPRKPARNRGHLPRVERVIEPASTLCPCGCGEMARIGENVSERLDVIPAQFQVLVTRRPRYACRRCSQAVVQAHAPEHVVPGGLPTERLIAWIIISKFGDHLPFYRQAGIFERQGLHLDRDTFGNWAGRACFHLMPVIDHMKVHLRAADRIFVDETRFIDDGTLELDTNPVENQIRPIALTRKNALFAGNEIGAENWAMLASLVATCKLSGVNPVRFVTGLAQGRCSRAAADALHGQP